MRVVLLPCLVLCAACGTSSQDTAKSSSKAAPAATPKKGEPAKVEEDAIDRNTTAYGDARPIPKANDAEVADFNRIWELFRKDDPTWPRERDRFKRRSDAAGYLLAGHLIRFYMLANMQREKAAKAVVRAKNEIVEVGAPCAPPLIDLMILDQIPLPDDRHFLPDDLTRYDCVDMLERMGSQSVPDLLRALARKDLGPKSRRFIALALGGTKDPRAYEPLVKLLKNDPSWQVRADAATALGKLGDPRAKEPLTAAVKSDADAWVVKSAGKARDQLSRKP